MVIEENWWPWKPSLFTQHRIRIVNELRLAQRHAHCDELRRQKALVEEDITRLLQRITPIDFAQIDQRLNSCVTKHKHTLKDYFRVKKQLIHLTPKLLLGNVYYRTNLNEISIKIQPIHTKKRRKRLKLTVEQQWKKGIGDAYRKIQIQRDNEHKLNVDPPNNNISIFTEPLPIVNDYLPDEPPIVTENIIDVIQDHEFLPPLPPPPLDEIIIPFQTPPPPITYRSPPSDRLQLAVDDTIVKPHRLVNKTLGNITQMSFHIDPEQCSSPKPEERKKKKAKLKDLKLPPPAPIFSSTAIFDTHAFFTQTNNKAKKQKKKIDISRQPVVMTTNDIPKKRGRTKKSSPYDFQEDDTMTLSRTKSVKLLTDDIITARFAKNSHFQSHQTSMASTKSSKSHHKSSEREHKKKKKNILGIGTSSPSISSTNLTLSPGRLSTDDNNNDDDYTMKSSLSKRHTRTNKSRRTRVK